MTKKQKIIVLDLLTDANKDKALFLNRLSKASCINIINKNHPLILSGYLIIIKPKDIVEQKMSENMAIVELSKKGEAFLKLTMTEVHY